MESVDSKGSGHPATSSAGHVSRRTVLALAASACAPVFAQAPFPGKPIRLLVGFPAGGAADVLTRIMAGGLSQRVGQPVTIDNRPGAEGIIAATELLKAPPDGHTIFMGTVTTMISVPSLKANPPFQPRDFTPLSTAGEFLYFLVVPANFPANNVRELLDLVRANPGKFNSGSSNSAAELAMLQLLGDRKVVNVRYKGDVPAMTDLVAGNIHMIFTTGTQAPGFVKDGRVKALLVLQGERSALLPDVPTAKESGLPELPIRPWAGFFGPPGMAPAVAERLSADLQHALQQPQVRAQLAQQGFQGYGMDPRAFAGFYRKQYDLFNQVVRENNLKFD
ncbi:MAG TPA: tripartite tricarboxylate transporter substrate binding protein [Ramlibacter sp.]